MRVRACVFVPIPFSNHLECKSPRSLPRNGCKDVQQQNTVYPLAHKKHQHRSVRPSPQAILQRMVSGLSELREDNGGGGAAIRYSANPVWAGVLIRPTPLLVDSCYKWRRSRGDCSVVGRLVDFACTPFFGRSSAGALHTSAHTASVARRTQQSPWPRTARFLPSRFLLAVTQHHQARKHAHIHAHNTQTTQTTQHKHRARGPERRASDPTAFSSQAPPTLSQVLPDSAQPGAECVLLGSGFTPDCVAVFGGIRLPTKYWYVSLSARPANAYERALSVVACLCLALLWGRAPSHKVLACVLIGVRACVRACACVSLFRGH